MRNNRRLKPCTTTGNFLLFCLFFAVFLDQSNVATETTHPKRAIKQGIITGRTHVRQGTVETIAQHGQGRKKRLESDVERQTDESINAIRTGFYPS